MDPVSLIVTALASGAAAGLGDAASMAVKDAYQVLRRLVQRSMVTDAAAGTVLDEHAKAPEVWEKPLEQQIHRHKVEQDPEVIEAAQRVMAIVDSPGTQAGRYNVHVQAGGNVRMKVDNRKKRTNIVLGGGFVLALVLLLIWMQYSARSTTRQELQSYRGGVSATCQRVQQSTPQTQPHVDQSGIYFVRKEILQAVKKADKVREEQLAGLLQLPYPSSVADEYEAVQQAEKATEAAQPAFFKEISGWPKKISMDKLQGLSQGPAASAAQDSSRRLADALTRLAGESCPLVPA